MKDGSHNLVAQHNQETVLNLLQSRLLASRLKFMSFAELWEKEGKGLVRCAGDIECDGLYDDSSV